MMFYPEVAQIVLKCAKFRLNGDQTIIEMAEPVLFKCPIQAE
jgi:hypothetical protein